MRTVEYIYLLPLILLYNSDIEGALNQYQIANKLSVIAHSNDELGKKVIIGCP